MQYHFYSDDDAMTDLSHSSSSSSLFFLIVLQMVSHQSPYHAVNAK